VLWGYANGWEVIYSAKHAAAIATRATTTRGDESAPAPFLLREVPLLGEAAADEEAGEAADDEELGVSPFARDIAATSLGNEMGLLARGLRSTAPLWEIVSGFTARKDLVYITFSRVNA
jgi:hypothetical protein